MPKEVVEIVIPTSLDATEVLQPGKEALDFPAPAITAEGSAVLGYILSSTGVRRNHLHTALGKFGIQAIAIICIIANQAFDRLPDEDLGQSLLHRVT